MQKRMLILNLPVNRVNGCAAESEFDAYLFKRPSLDA